MLESAHAPPHCLRDRIGRPSLARARPSRRISDANGNSGCFVNRRRSHADEPCDRNARSRSTVCSSPRFSPDGPDEAATLLAERLLEFEADHPGVRIEVRVKAQSGSASLIVALAAASRPPRPSCPTWSPSMGRIWQPPTPTA